MHSCIHISNPPDRTIGSVSSGLIYQNPVAINTDNYSDSHQSINF